MGKFKELKEKLQKCHKESNSPKSLLCRCSDHSSESQEEYKRMAADVQNQQKECHNYFKELHKSKIELHRMHRHARFSPPLILILNLLIWYLVFKYAGIKEVSIFFAVLLTAGGFLEFFFLRKIERRILTPIDTLKNGIEEIAKGNYNVKVESSVHNEISLLIDSFNKMALKLQESERIKAEYEENRRALIANISHDLKTPITSIQGYIEAITEGNIEAPEDINRYLKIVHNNTTYINKLIDDLFFFSKMDMQKMAFQFVTVNVRDFVQDLMEEFKLELEEKNIEFNYYDNLKADYDFNIDRKRLHQVFRNIIGNAEKYGPEQNLSIRAELYRLNDFVAVTIKDNGPGINEDKLPHIFERFYRIDSERTKDLMSTGLGLAIAKELIEAHGGSISVTSTENEGTCFTVRLPMKQ